MSASNTYITAPQFKGILDTLNIQNMDDVALQDILDRATGDVEAELCERFLVPLVAKGGGDYSTAPPFARQKVLNALRAAVKKVIGEDKAANVVVDSTERYVDVNKASFDMHIKTLLNPKKHFDFSMQPQAEGSIDPIQSVGLARADNELHASPDLSGIL